MRTEVLQITDDPSVTLTTYLHDVSRELPNADIRPAVLVIPGGGYHMCSDREAEPVALAYMAEGFNAFVLRYTVGSRSVFPIPLQDAETALRLILEHAEEYHVDTQKIAAIGFSAGGHLTAALGTIGSIKPNALILAYPCILESMGKSLANPVPGLDDKVSAETPPTFLFSTADDSVVPIENTLAFAGALAKNNIPFETHIFQKGQHGLSLAKPHTSSGSKEMVEPAVAQWFPLSVDWLHRLWGNFS